MGMTSLHDLSSPISQKNRPCLKGNANRMENEIIFFISYPEVPLTLYKGNANRMENEIIFLFLILRCRLLYTEVIIIFNMISKVCFFINIYIKQSAQVPHNNAEPRRTTFILSVMSVDYLSHLPTRPLPLLLYITSQPSCHSQYTYHEASC